MVFGLSFGETALIMATAVAVFGPKDVPIMARALGRLTGRSVAYILKMREKFSEISEKSDIQKLHRELQDTIAQVQAIKHELSYGINPLVLHDRIVGHTRLSSTAISSSPASPNEKQNTDLLKDQRRLRTDFHQHNTNNHHQLRAPISQTFPFALPIETNSMQESSPSFTLPSSDPSSPPDQQPLFTNPHILSYKEKAEILFQHAHSNSLNPDLRPDSNSEPNLNSDSDSGSKTDADDVFIDKEKIQRGEFSHHVVLPVSAVRAGLIPNRMGCETGGDIISDALMEREVGIRALEALKTM